MIIVLQNFIKRYKYLIVTIIILISASIVAINFPSESEYYRGADEGKYFRQGKILADNGYAGFKIITRDYLNNVALQDAPTPFRIGANVLVAIALAVDESYTSIAMVSLLCFIIFLLGTFYFVERFWGISVALITLLLLSFSPLEMAMAKRALMDMPALMALAFSCYALWLWLNSKSKYHLFAFILCTIISILLKEVNIIFMFVFAMMIILIGSANKLSISISQACWAIIVPPAVVSGIYLLIFGFDDIILLFKTTQTAVSNSTYRELYVQGPWYRILLDYLMLSPLTLILAIGFIGHTVFNKSSDMNTKFLLILTVFMIIAFGILPKNVRYAMLFDVPLRLFAAIGLLMLNRRFGEMRPKWNIAHFLILVVIFTDLQSFHTYFVVNDIYDPISFNLLKAIKVIPR